MLKAPGCPIIIGGFLRSGSSLLRRLLDSHHSIHCSPEIKFFRDFYGNYLYDELGHLRFFSTARTMGLGENTLLEVFGRAFIECHERAAKESGKIRWADKNPENVLYLNQWHTLLDGDFVFINVVRNPLDALASLKEAGFRKTVPGPFVEKVELCKVYLGSAFCFIDQHPKISYTISYENLVSTPRKTLTELLAYLGEPYSESLLTDFCSHDRKTGIEDPKVSTTTSIHAYSVGRWKRDLSEAERNICLKQLGGWIKRLGYANS